MLAHNDISKSQNTFEQDYKEIRELERELESELNQNCELETTIKKNTKDLNKSCLKLNESKFKLLRLQNKIYTSPKYTKLRIKSSFKTNEKLEEEYNKKLQLIYKRCRTTKHSSF